MPVLKMKKVENQSDNATQASEETVLENPVNEAISEEQSTETSAEVEINSPEEDALTKTQNELSEWKNKFLLLAADFENARKRNAKERIELISTASEGVIKDLLPVIDDFERAIQAMENAQDIEALKEGVNLVHNKFLKVLEGKGLKNMEAKGEAFNPDIHEAIAQIPASAEEKGKVIDVVEKGYFLHDKTIRFAKVVIGN